MRIDPKINIFLKIIGKNGGFHSLISRFVRVSGTLYDEMEVRSFSHFKIEGNFDCSLEDNLIFKAKQALGEFLAFKGKSPKILESFKIIVQKHIPAGAGLGGGSANAGAFLNAMNRLLELQLSQNELIHIGMRVGSDVGFCASGLKSANVRGRGEIIESFEEENINLSIHTAPFACDTAKVYQIYADCINAQKHAYSEIPNEWLYQKSIDILKANTHLPDSKQLLNDLYMPACEVYPALKDISENLGEGWFLSGSGSSFFKVIENQKSAVKEVAK